MKYLTQCRTPNDLLQKAGFTRDHESINGWAISLVKPRRKEQTILKRANEKVGLKFDQIHAVISGDYISIHRDFGESAHTHRTDQKHEKVSIYLKKIKSLDIPGHLQVICNC